MGRIPKMWSGRGEDKGVDRYTFLTLNYCGSPGKLIGFGLGTGSPCQRNQEREVNHHRYGLLFTSLEDLPSPIPTRASAMLSLHAVSMPGATEDIASHLRRTIADAVMHLHVPRGAASTGNIKVAFCQSFSVRRHKARASRSLRTCGLPGAGRAPMTAADETRLLMLQPCPLYSSALGFRCGKHCQ